jgi:hypothetical protein
VITLGCILSRTSIFIPPAMPWYHTDDWIIDSRGWTCHADGQHRAECGAHDALGDASHDQMAESGAATGGHDDQVHVFGFSNLDDLSVWCPCHHAASDLYFDALGRWQDALKLKAPLALQVFNQWHAHTLRDIAFNRECGSSTTCRNRSFAPNFRASSYAYSSACVEKSEQSVGAQI